MAGELESFSQKTSDFNSHHCTFSVFSEQSKEMTSNDKEMHSSKKEKKATMKRHSWAQFGKARVPKTSRVASKYPHICTMVHKHTIRDRDIQEAQGGNV